MCYNKAKVIFGNREKFSILNIHPTGAERVLLGVDEDKKLHLEPVLKLPEFMGRIGRKNETTIINIHPSLGAVRVAPFHFSRDSKNEPLLLAELENFLAKLAQKYFLDLRSEIAHELGVDELDTILVESRSFAYRSDGSAVNSPLGHMTKEIHGFLELLFTTRKAFDLMQPTLYTGAPVFLTLRDKAELISLLKLGKTKLSLVECSDDGGSRLLNYNLSKGSKEVLSRRSVNWSHARFFSRLEELWNVDPEVALSIYRKYLENELSPKLRGDVEKVWKAEIKALFAALKEAGAKGEVYFKSAVRLPFDFPIKQAGITLLEFPFEELLIKLGFGLDEKMASLPRDAAFAQLAPLIECYYDNSDRNVNHSLRRRIHWLIS